MTVLQGGDDYLLDSMREQSLRAFRALCLPSQPLQGLRAEVCPLWGQSACGTSPTSTAQEGG